MNEKQRSSEVVAVYFPSYHRDPLYDQWYGKDFTEWDLMEKACPLFEGHEQPKLCTWGSFDEADPLWMEKQIDLAADHGITTFLFDWYWFSGQKFLYRALEEGFLRARNRHRLKFFIMWANVTWGSFPACRDRFRGHTNEQGTNFGQALTYDGPLLPIKHTLEDLERVTEYCIEQYMREPNYLHVEDDPVFSFWRFEELETQLGSLEAVAEGFERMRRVARRAGFDGLHITVNIACFENGQTLHCWWPDLVERIKRCGGDSVYGYNVARTDDFDQLTNDKPLVPYDDVIRSHEQLFRMCENMGLPFHPTATIGFDNSPRWHPGAKLPLDFRKLQYEPIVVGNTPEKFKEVVHKCLDSIERQNGPNRMLLVNAWNEWTEGNYLLPDQRYGTGYLEALRDVIERSNENNNGTNISLRR